MSHLILFMPFAAWAVFCHRSRCHVHRIGTLTAGISPEIGIFYDHSALHLHKGNVLFVPAITIHGDVALSYGRMHDHYVLNDGKEFGLNPVCSGPFRFAGQSVVDLLVRHVFEVFRP